MSANTIMNRFVLAMAFWRKGLRPSPLSLWLCITGSNRRYTRMVYGSNDRKVAGLFRQEGPVTGSSTQSGAHIVGSCLVVSPGTIWEDPPGHGASLWRTTAKARCDEWS